MARNSGSGALTLATELTHETEEGRSSHAPPTAPLKGGPSRTAPCRAEASFIYQLEARYWPLLHWKTRLTERARSTAQLHKDVSDWWKLATAPALSNERQVLHLISALPFAQQQRILRELAQRGCVVARPKQIISPGHAVMAAEKFLTP